MNIDDETKFLHVISETNDVLFDSLIMSAEISIHSDESDLNKSMMISIFELSKENVKLRDKINSLESDFRKLEDAHTLCMELVAGVMNGN